MDNNLLENASQVVFIGVGSNIEPERHIIEALRALQQKIKLTGVSTFYRTAPVGAADQPWYLNGVVAARTAYTPRALKYDILRPIEETLGRTRTGDKNAARTIDLDVLLFGGLCINEPGLTIPDPDLHERPFLLAGIHELQPECRIPDSGEFVRDLVYDARSTLAAETAFTARLKEMLQ